MSSEYDSAAEREERDWTKWIWGGVALLLLVMIGTYAMRGRITSEVSTVRCRHILIRFDKANPADRARAYDLARELRQRIADGEDFAKLAREYSNDPDSQPRGGDLGYSRKGDYVKEIERFIWTAKIGEVSDVIETGFGFHLVQTLDRQITEADRLLESGAPFYETETSPSPAGGGGASATE